MTENWDGYFCVVEEARAFIVVDLGLAARAPMPDCSVLGHVGVQLRSPDEDGFPEEKEEEELNRLEDSLVAAVRDAGEGVCAGHCFSRGRLDLFFYLRDEGEGWTERVAGAFGVSRSHEWATGRHADPEWELYFGFLYPDPQTLLHMQNRRGREELLAMGDDLELSRRVEHWAEFPSLEQGENFGRAARALGYALEEVGLAETEEGGGEAFDADEDGEGSSAPVESGTRFVFFAPSSGVRSSGWQVRLSRMDRMKDIDETSAVLFDLAREHGGEYAGWACLPWSDANPESSSEASR